MPVAPARSEAGLCGLLLSFYVSVMAVRSASGTLGTRYGSVRHPVYRSAAREPSSVTRTKCFFRMALKLALKLPSALQTRATPRNYSDLTIRVRINAGPVDTGAVTPLGAIASLEIGNPEDTCCAAPCSPVAGRRPRGYIRCP